MEKERRQELEREFLERYAEYEEAKKEMWSQYEAQHPGASWDLNFSTGVLTIREPEA